MRNAVVATSLALATLFTTTSASLAQSSPPLTEADISALAHNPAVKAAASACSDDRWRLCPAVMPGGGRIVRCLAANPDALSPGCRAAILKARDQVAATRDGNASPPPAK